VFISKRILELKCDRGLVKTDDNYSEAEVNFELTEKLLRDQLGSSLKGASVIVCGGFIGSNSRNSVTTLGRGGSDYSAAVVARCIGAERLEIWTDVDGIMTCDPRIISQAKPLKEVSYLEAAELAYFGAKVIHPKTIFPAVNAGIPVFVLNSYNPGSEGTLIRNSVEHTNKIKAIAFRRNITVINITSNRMLGAYGFLAKVFEVFLRHETSVDLVTTSEVSVSLSIDNDKNLDRIVESLSQFARLDVFRRRAVISAVGEGIRNTSGIAARFFGVLKGINVSMISFGASEINLSIIVEEQDLEDAVKLLHSEFFAD
jgi:aspartate kinase